MTRVAWQTSMGEFWVLIADDQVAAFVASIEALGFTAVVR
jgi:hypothetical protein